MMVATAKNVDSNSNEAYRPYDRYGVPRPTDSMLTAIFSEKLPKAYQNFSGEKLHKLRVQAALIEQGYGQLVVGDKHPSHPYGMDGLFHKNSNNARQAWIANNPQWIDKSFKEIDQEILRRSYNNLGVASPKFPDAGETKDKYLLLLKTKHPSVKFQFSDGRVVTETFYKAYEDLLSEFKYDANEAKALYGQGKVDESNAKFAAAKRDFVGQAVKFENQFPTEDLKAQWRAQFMNTVNAYDGWRKGGNLAKA